MRIAHTADWHLGRVFHGLHLTDDQAHLLDELSRLLVDGGIECLIIAGDIYDRSVPPVEAVELLDEFLYRTVVDRGIPVIMATGNHDSASRLRFASRLLEAKGLHIASRSDTVPAAVVLEDAHGEVWFYALPFLEPSLVRAALGDPEIRSQHASVTAMLGRIAEKKPAGKRAVLSAHCFVEGGSACESERPLSVGGLESVPAGVFSDYRYVALGHLHRPQSFTAVHAHYAGSLMRYSFSEVDHDKSIRIVEMDRDGACTTEQVSLTPRRQIRRVRGLFDDIIRSGAEDRHREDYILAEILDTEPIYEAMRKLRELYPNALHIERPVFSPSGEEHLRPDHRKIGPAELFSAFYRQTVGAELSEDQREAFASVLDDLRLTEQEVPV